ncbi:MAG: Unknown protein [uncultured Thiotrichaceae bacterium]|uniref:Uncharacterized protein n=1 Tax=uncultured Thiotrichaceae bacterium TaxID=298394 RepID=A0A6S6U1I8_9GAMM|nr:MAG: Unknown protein [uncultured Thiotrichaceae bacterium]
MKQLIINTMIFLMLASAVAGIKAESVTSQTPQNETSTFTFSTLKAAFQFGWRTGWAKNGYVYGSD